MADKTRQKKKVNKAVALEPRREVQRIHHWKPEDDPQDELAPGWEYLHISGDYQSDTRDKRDKYKKGGGPESGLPCMHCGEMTRIVDEVSGLDIMEQEYEVKDEAKRKQLAAARVVILLCPRCESITQFRADLIRDLRRRSMEKNNA